LPCLDPIENFPHRCLGRGGDQNLDELRRGFGTRVPPDGRHGNCRGHEYSWSRLLQPWGNRPGSMTMVPAGGLERSWVMRSGASPRRDAVERLADIVSSPVLNVLVGIAGVAMPVIV
jgi:hypothetical protein